MHITLLLLFYCSLSIKTSGGKALRFVYVYPDCRTARLLVAEGAGWKLWATKARRPKNEPPHSQSHFSALACFFLCLETSRSICEMEKPNNSNKNECPFPHALPAFGGLARLCSTQQPLPKPARVHAHPRRGLAAAGLWWQFISPCPCAGPGLRKVSWKNLLVRSNKTCDSEVYLQQISPVPI